VTTADVAPFLLHVISQTAEMTVLSYGGSLGYSSPLTLRDDGACDENGNPAGGEHHLKGDTRIFRLDRSCSCVN
jgi:hypothetical protein